MSESDCGIDTWLDPRRGRTRLATGGVESPVLSMRIRYLSTTPRLGLRVSDAPLREETKESSREESVASLPVTIPHARFGCNDDIPVLVRLGWLRLSRLVAIFGQRIEPLRSYTIVTA